MHPMKSGKKILSQFLVVVLTILVAFFRFLLSFSSSFLNFISSIFGVFGVIAIFIYGASMEVVLFFLLSFLFSPYGLQMAADFAIDKLEEFKYSLKND